MKTLKEISRLNPSLYRVIDNVVLRDKQPKGWGDKIEIIGKGNKQRFI